MIFRNVKALTVCDYDCLATVTVYNADGSVYATGNDSVGNNISTSASITEELKTLGKELAKFANSGNQRHRSKLRTGNSENPAPAATAAGAT